MDYHNQSPQQVLQALQSDDHRGLTAQQAQQRQAQYGPNQLRGKKKSRCCAALPSSLSTQ